jgi:DNA-binding NarL/FixJ family response regulator
MSIYVIGEHPLVRQALAMLVQNIRPGARVLELDRLGGLEQAVAEHGLPPELFCLDLDLRGLRGAHGASGARSVKTLYPGTPLAVLSSADDEELEAQCMQAGADIYIEKSASVAEINAALSAILTPETAPADLATASGSIPLGPAAARLSRRQQQLIAMLDEGQSNRDMAAHLGITEHTVKVHLWRLFRRIGVKSRTQALHYARVNGLLDR